MTRTGRHGYAGGNVLVYNDFPDASHSMTVRLLQRRYSEGAGTRFDRLLLQGTSEPKESFGKTQTG